MIRNVVLDIGGVLVDYHTVSFYENRGYDPELSKRLADATMYGPYWEQQDLGLMSSDWIFSKMKEAHPEFSAIIDQNLYDQTGIVTRRAESKAWIEHLRQSGYRVLVLSNFSQNALDHCPDALDFLSSDLGGSGNTGDPGVITENGRTHLYTGFCPVPDKSRHGVMHTVLGEDMLTIVKGPRFIMPSQPYSAGSGYEGHEFFEASSIRKRNGIYYFIYSSVVLH